MPRWELQFRGKAPNEIIKVPADELSPEAEESLKGTAGFLAAVPIAEGDGDGRKPKKEDRTDYFKDLSQSSEATDEFGSYDFGGFYLFLNTGFPDEPHVIVECDTRLSWSYTVFPTKEEALKEWERIREEFIESRSEEERAEIEGGGNGEGPARKGAAKRPTKPYCCANCGFAYSAKAYEKYKGACPECGGELEECHHPPSVHSEDNSTKRRLAKLTPEEDHAWTFAFIFYVNEGKSDLEADKLAWQDVQKEFPRLRAYQGALPDGDGDVTLKDIGLQALKIMRDQKVPVEEAYRMARKTLGMDGPVRMKLLTKEIEKALPPLYSTEEVPEEDKVLVAKFFTPDANWTWYATEGDWIDEDGTPVRESKKPPVNYLFFGYVRGLENEWGYFNLNELTEATGPMGLHIERDKFWTPKKFKDLGESDGMATDGTIKFEPARHEDAKTWIRARLGRGEVAELYDGSGWRVLFYPPDGERFGTPVGFKEEGGMDYLQVGAGMIDTWDWTVFNYPFRPEDWYEPIGTVRIGEKRRGREGDDGRKRIRTRPPRNIPSDQIKTIVMMWNDGKEFGEISKFTGIPYGKVEEICSEYEFYKFASMQDEDSDEWKEHLKALRTSSQYRKVVAARDAYLTEKPSTAPRVEPLPGGKADWEKTIEDAKKTVVADWEKTLKGKKS